MTRCWTPASKSLQVYYSFLMRQLRLEEGDETEAIPLPPLEALGEAPAAPVSEGVVESMG